MMPNETQLSANEGGKKLSGILISLLIISVGIIVILYIYLFYLWIGSSIFFLIFLPVLFIIIHSVHHTLKTRWNESLAVKTSWILFITSCVFFTFLLSRVHHQFAGLWSLKNYLALNLFVSLVMSIAWVYFIFKKIFNNKTLAVKVSIILFVLTLIYFIYLII